MRAPVQDPVCSAAARCAIRPDGPTARRPDGPVCVAARCAMSSDGPMVRWSDCPVIRCCGPAGYGQGREPTGMTYWTGTFRPFRRPGFQRGDCSRMRMESRKTTIRALGRSGTAAPSPSAYPVVAVSSNSAAQSLRSGLMAWPGRRRAVRRRRGSAASGRPCRSGWPIRAPR